MKTPSKKIHGAVRDRSTTTTSPSSSPGDTKQAKSNRSSSTSTKTSPRKRSNVERVPGGVSPNVPPGHSPYRGIKPWKRRAGPPPDGSARNWSPAADRHFRDTPGTKQAAAGRPPRAKPAVPPSKKEPPPTADLQQRRCTTDFVLLPALRPVQ